MSLRHGRMVSRAARLKRLGRRGSALKLLIHLACDTRKFQEHLVYIKEARARIDMQLRMPAHLLQEPQ